MKKLSAIILSMTVLTGLFAFTASADTYKTVDQTLINETVEYFEDGSSAVISVYEDNLPLTRAAAYNKSGSKKYVSRNKDGKALWEFTVNGVFNVNPGVSATCTSATYKSNIIDTSWHLKTASASKSGNKAIGKATYQHKVLFVVTDTENCTVELKCDSNGNLS